MLSRTIRERRPRRSYRFHRRASYRRTIYTSFHAADIYAFNRENTFGHRYIRRSYRVSQLLARRERHNHDDAREESLNSARTTALSRPIKVPPPILFEREENTDRRKIRFREKLSHQGVISRSESGYHRRWIRKPRSGKKRSQFPSPSNDHNCKSGVAMLTTAVLLLLLLLLQQRRPLMTPSHLEISTLRRTRARVKTADL